MTPMKNLVRTVFASACLFALAGCAGHKDPAPAAATLNSKCVISGKPVDAKVATVAYDNGKVGFCCDQCPAKWTAMDDAGKKAALAKAK